MERLDSEGPRLNAEPETRRANVPPSAARRFAACLGRDGKWNVRLFCCATVALILSMILGFPSSIFPQTASTGALTGMAIGPTGAGLPGVAVRLINQDTTDEKSVTSDEDGRFTFALQRTGQYRLEATKPGFAVLNLGGISISVTETLRLEFRLRVATVVENLEVSAEIPMIETDDPALGRVVSETGVTTLPLATRNFAQIAGLSPGVVTGVFNAGELGLGGTAMSQINQSNDGIYVHGTRSYDNNFQLDGISVSDVQGSSSASGGIPIPSPDAVQEFKVQTGLYDAGYGRYGGASISVVTKSGSNAYHGSLFEFFRNDALNANLFFANQTGQRRPVLKQNQFGFVLGGPIKKDKLLFFGSYQGTRQINGLAAGQARTACTVSLNMPALTDDRSPAALGRLFAGRSGALGGVAIEPDGGNINPAALALLNFRLPNGSYLFPTPETVDASRPPDSQGFSTFSQPCRYDEDQFLANADFITSTKSRFSVRSFVADDATLVPFPGGGLNIYGNLPGFPSNVDNTFRDISLAHVYTINTHWLNEARVGYVRTQGDTTAQAPFRWSDVGVAAGAMNDSNELVNLNILGSASIATAFPRTFTQNSFQLTDDLSFFQGRHTVRLGGSLTRLQDNIAVVGLGSFMQFLSWPDFLLGLDAAQNGTNRFSNVYASVDVYGLMDREYRTWEGSAYIQDSFRILPSLTLDLGVRYERLGQFADKLGRNASFDIAKADPNSPPEGSVAGYVVAANFPGAVPSGVTRAGNDFGNNGDGQNGLAPRVGFAWQAIPGPSSLVMRGAYGIYYSRPTGQAFFQSVFGAPFSLGRLNIGGANAEATFQVPFPQPFPTPESFPLFPSYSPNSGISVEALSPDFRPAFIQQFGFNAQSELYRGWLLELGYVGTRGTHLLRTRSFDQALDASPGHPIRGETTNTLENIPLRVPLPGISSDGVEFTESAGNSWYNSLEASLTKRLSSGLQFLAAYTFSKTLDTDGAVIDGTSAGNTLTLGDQNSPRQRWGRASFDRTNRFILSGTYTLPSPHDSLKRTILGGWGLAEVATIQSGNAMTIANTNSTNVFGISEDRAQLSGSCARNELINNGSIQSKLNRYFNASCFTTPPVIGADGIGTAFGDSGTGIVDGPRQANIDIAVLKTVNVPWPKEGSNLQLRCEFFNALNHPQFANPDANFSSPTFGVINSTSVNARLIQLALKLGF
jgi:Carboxypeptidase regulatory-like domain/TonB dependent receptor